MTHPPHRCCSHRCALNSPLPKSPSLKCIKILKRDANSMVYGYWTALKFVAEDKDKGLKESMMSDAVYLADRSALWARLSLTGHMLGVDGVFYMPNSNLLTWAGIAARWAFLCHGNAFQDDLQQMMLQMWRRRQLSFTSFFLGYITHYDRSITLLIISVCCTPPMKSRCMISRIEWLRWVLDYLSRISASSLIILTKKGEWKCYVHGRIPEYQ